MDLNDGLWLLGALLVAGGAGMVYLPAGVIVGGLACVAAGALGLGRKVRR